MPLCCVLQIDHQPSRLAVRHHDMLWEFFQLRERETIDALPWLEKPCPCIDRCAGHQRQQHHCSHSWHGSQEHPQPVPSARQSFAEIVVICLLCNLPNGRLAQAPRTQLLGATAHNLNDA